MDRFELPSWWPAETDRGMNRSWWITMRSANSSWASLAHTIVKRASSPRRPEPVPLGFEIGRAHSTFKNIRWKANGS